MISQYCHALDGFLGHSTQFFTKVELGNMYWCQFNRWVPSSPTIGYYKITMLPDLIGDRFQSACLKISDKHPKSRGMRKSATPMRIFERDHRSKVRRSIFDVLALSLSLIAGCATPPDPADKEATAEFRQINDPAEPANRAVFAFNQVLDKGIIKPAAGMYRDLIPPAVRTGVRNALDNLRSPVVFFNDALQGDLDRAGITFMRFLINSTIGIAGLGDLATDMGYAYHNEDFGQTLAKWGVDDGPYVMLPVFGPSNPRDAVGLVIDFLIDPFNWWAANIDNDLAPYARGTTRAIDERARNYDTLEDLERSSLDFYATIRSLYRQRRADEVGNGTTTIRPAPDLSRTPPSLDPRQQKI